MVTDTWRGRDLTGTGMYVLPPDMRAIHRRVGPSLYRDPPAGRIADSDSRLRSADNR